ncbi:MAG: prolyl oligopeptidase family serine peptidase [Lentisphaeria bacterium]|nr:prolyl oligopeptidase family serine peptidase [Lentisphaeria bacterium]
MAQIESKLYLPGEISCEEWLGALRHKIVLDGTTAWVVEPADPLPGKKWFWLPEWPDAFPERNGVCELLQMGYHMIYINIYGQYANDGALEIMKRFYDYLKGLGFASKGALIGMSLGGLYSFRYAQKYPETVACIYADAPVCDLNYRVDTKRGDAAAIAAAYGVGMDGLENHPLSPVNNFLPIVEAGIPLLLLMGLADTVLPPERNGLLLAERWRKAGGMIEVIERPSWGHHPHGLDNPLKIVRFVLQHTLNKA